MSSESFCVTIKYKAIDLTYSRVLQGLAKSMNGKEGNSSASIGTSICEDDFIFRSEKDAEKFIETLSNLLKEACSSKIL